jgi:hypothetical protein
MKINHSMNKQYYIKLIKDSPWKWVKNYFDNLDTFVPKKLAKLDIKTEEWVKFSIDYFDQALQTHEEPKPHYTEFANKISALNVAMGRNIHNSFELYYGTQEETNQKIIELLGESNRKRLRLIPDFLLLKLIVKMPGHGSAWHIDHLGRYTEKFGDRLNIDKSTHRCQYGQVVRLWFPITDWDNGHMFQISETVLTNWQPGDVYQIPFGMGHCSANAGYVPLMTVSLTGIIDE